MSIQITNASSSSGSSITRTAVTMTPNAAGFGTISNAAYYADQIGKQVTFTGFFNAGTTAASSAYVVLPVGYTIDTSKYTASNNNLLGRANKIQDSVGVDNNPSLAFTDGSTNDRVFFCNTPVGVNSLTQDNVDNFIGSTRGFMFSFTVWVT